MTSMGQRFSCNELRVKNTLSCSAETSLASDPASTSATETIAFSTIELAENLMFVYLLRAPTTPSATQTLTINLPTSNYLPIFNTFISNDSQEAGATTEELLSIRKVSATEYKLVRTTADGSNIAQSTYVQVFLTTYD